MKINEAYSCGNPPLCCGTAALPADTLSFLNAVNQLWRPVVDCVSYVPFEVNCAQLGEDITHKPGTSDFLLHRAGYYEIFYAASVMSTNRQAVAALLRTDEAMIPGTYSEDTVSRLHPTGSLSGMGILHIHAPAIVRLVNAVACTVYASASLYCRKIC